MWWLRTRYYNNGKTEGKIFSEEGCKDIAKVEFTSYPLYDEYWDCFDSYSKASKGLTECLTA